MLIGYKGVEPRIGGKLGTVELGDNTSVKVMGVINVSPESFFKGSVRRGSAEIGRAAQQMQVEGASLIDIGAKSTAPYLNTGIPANVEEERLIRAIRAVISSGCSLPISADTTSSRVAEAALPNGASVINDVSGLTADPKMADFLSGQACQILIVGRVKSAHRKAPIREVVDAIDRSISVAKSAGIDLERIAIDPGIGFASGVNQVLWNSNVIAHLLELRKFQRPICVGVSRKRFLGEILGKPDPADRIYGSLSAESLCVFNGAHLIRTHNVRETLEAVRVAEAVRSARSSSSDNA